MAVFGLLRRLLWVLRGWKVVCDSAQAVLARSPGGGGCGGEGKQTYRSGLFWVSMTAAMGMPKLETGPQKSVQSGRRG